MSSTKLIKILGILGCVGIYGYTALDTNSRNVYSVSVNLAAPVLIVWPFEVAIVGDDGERGLRIGPGVGRGWCNEAGGEAAYKFYIPKEDTYRVWGYCLWFDECANAVFAKIDDLDKAILGNDPVYKQWHWVRGFDVHLERGTHTLVLSNHSDHISLQKVLFTNSTSVTPEDSSLVFSDIFYEGFDGCDRVGLDSWEKVSGDWSVQSLTPQMCFAENALVGKCEDRSVIIYRSDHWSRYCVNVVTRFEASEGANGCVGVCFGVKDSGQYYQLQWRRISGSERVRLNVGRRTAQGTVVLSRFEVRWDPDAWHHVEVAANAGEIAVKVDDGEPIRIGVEHTVAGGIGLCLEGTVTAYFDDIHVREIGESVM